jgi:hypothetical protein
MFNVDVYHNFISASGWLHVHIIRIATFAYPFFSICLTRASLRQKQDSSPISGLEYYITSLYWTDNADNICQDITYIQYTSILCQVIILNELTLFEKMKVE